MFSTMEAKIDYWKIEITPEDQEKTTFTTHYGTCAFTHMAFGLKNEAVTYQRAIDRILKTVKMQFDFVYPDDIIVYSSTYVIHKVHVANLLTPLRDTEETLCLIKSKLFHKKIN